MVAVAALLAGGVAVPGPAAIAAPARPRVAQPMQPSSWVLAGTGSVEGVVTAEDTGAPLEGVCVSTSYADRDLAEPPLAAPVCSGADGHYLLTGVAPGFHVVEFRPPAASPYRTEYSGGQYEPWPSDAAVAVAVVDGEVATADAVLDLGSVIEGVVISSLSGAPLQGVEVGTPGRLALTGVDGSFQLGGFAPNAEAAVVLRATDGLHGSATVGLTAGGAGTTAQAGTIGLVVGGVLRGTVTDDLGAPVDGACLEVRRLQIISDTERRVSTAEAEGQSVGGELAAPPFYGEARTCTGADGTYEFPLLSGGRYTIWVEHPLGPYRQHYVGLVAGTTVYDLVLPRPMLFTGRVTDSVSGDPVALGSVSIGGLQASVQPDGTYEIVSWPGHWSLWWTSPTGPYLGTSTNLTTDPGEVRTVDLPVVRGGTVRGTVRDPGGLPVEGVSVRARGSASGERWATTATDGTYEVEGVLGLVEVELASTALHPGPTVRAVEQPVPVEVGSGAPVEGVDGVVQPLAQVEGTVTFADTGLGVPTSVEAIDTTTGEVAGWAQVVDGHYRLFADAGQYRIRASQWRDLAATFAPSVVTAAGATAVTLALGAPATADIVIPRVAPAMAPLPAPVRLVDTRPGQRGAIELPGGSVGGDVSAALQPGSTRRYVLRAQGGLPGGALAVALNVTAVKPSAPGHLTVWPCASLAAAVPATSTLNVGAGATTANAAIVALRGTGGVCLRASVSMHVVLDATAAAMNRFEAPVNPIRLYDSRPGQVGAVELPGGAVGFDEGTPLPAKTLRAVPLEATGVSSSASALVLNVTVANPAAGGYLALGGCWWLSQPPATSTLTFAAGSSRAISVVVAAGIGPQCLWASTDVHVVVDFIGSFESGFRPLVDLSPVRLLDTRPGMFGAAEHTALGDVDQPLQPGVVRRVAIGGLGGLAVHPGVTALTVTAVGASGAGYVTVYGCADTTDPAPPNSTLNVSVAAGAVANEALVQPVQGGVCVVSNIATHVVLDSAGTFLTGTSAP